MGGEPVGVGRVAEAELGREAQGEDQADRDRFAVEQRAEPGLAFDRVGEAVAEVEQGALAAAVLDVAGDRGAPWR